MPQFNEYESNGRRLAVEFKCRRCGGVRYEALESIVEKSEDNYGYLHNLNLPDGWHDFGHIALLCPTCTKDLKDFFNEKKQEEPTS